MESLSATSRRTVRSYSFLFRLLGKQLAEPSFGPLPYTIVSVLEILILMIYSIIPHFSSPDALRLSATFSDV